MPVLNPEQETALTALEWLLDHRPERRRRGRSTVLAIALIRHALTNPGLRVAVRDHAYRPGTEEIDRNLARLVATFVEGDAALRGMYRHELLASSVRHPILAFNAGLPGAASWLPVGWASAVERSWTRLPFPTENEIWTGIPMPPEALEEIMRDPEPIIESFFDSSWVAADRLRPVSPIRQVKAAPPQAHRSLWERLEDD